MRRSTTRLHQMSQERREALLRAYPRVSLQQLAVQHQDELLGRILGARLISEETKEERQHHPTTTSRHQLASTAATCAAYPSPQTEQLQLG